MTKNQIKGKCHCGKVKFSINCELKELRRCNCSHCRRKGYVMTTVNKDEFNLESGKDYLSIYQWNTKIAKHFFCKICGINTHNKRRTNPNAFGVNVGCLDGFDMSWIQNVSDFTNGQEFTLENRKQGEASLQKK